MTLYVDLPIETNPGAIEQEVYDALQVSFPGWEPSAGDLEVFMVKALSQMAADLAEIAVKVPPEIFRQYGELIVNVPSLLSAPATVESTWTMVDDAGYTIPAGTLVGIPLAGDELVAFEVVYDVTVAVGDTATAGGEVLLSAVIEGEAANELNGTPELIDALTFVNTITLTGTTAGGQDAEAPSAYLDRLAAEMTLLTSRPILPRDAEVLARRISGVERALALDGYNPADSTFNNERMVAVAVVDENGAALSSGVKNEVDALLQSEREVNFVFNVIDPTLNTIHVTAAVTTFPGYAAAAVEDAVEAQLAIYLDPANWGLTEPHEWDKVAVVRLNEVIALVDAVAGVDYVTAVTLAVGAGGASAADKNLTGAAPLTTPGTLTATATTP